MMQVVRADEASDAADAAANQKIEELRKKIDELTHQAEQFRGTVLEKQQEADSLKKQIDILNNQILQIQSQIGVTENKIAVAKLEITDREQKLYATQKSIAMQKAAIGEAMAYLHERDQTNVVSSFLKNPNLSDFANESQRVANLQTKLTSLINDLKKDKVLLEQQKTDLQKKQTDLEILNKNQVQQKQSLSGSKSTKNKLLVDTKGQESKYQKLLAETEKQRALYFAELQNLESNALANGSVIVHVTATAVPPRGTKIFDKPYDDKPYLSQGYGMTSYAKRGAYGGAIHNGADYVSGYGSPIHPIGSGVVLASGFNSGFGNWVAVKHEAGGGLVSVYGHMQAPTIMKQGAKVDHSSTLGFEGTTGNVTGSHVHLSLYKDFFTYNNPKTNQLNFNYANGSINPLDYIK